MINVDDLSDLDDFMGKNVIFGDTKFKLLDVHILPDVFGFMLEVDDFKAEYKDNNKSVPWIVKDKSVATYYRSSKKNFLIFPIGLLTEDNFKENLPILRVVE
jgi:hypothetical protein